MQLSISHAQYKKSYSITKDTFENGRTKETVEVWIKETKEFKLHEYEKSTKKVITRYYANGKVHYRLTYHTSMGPDEKPCSELLFVQEQFWINGKKKNYMKIKCDCHLYVYKEWNFNEQLLNKTRSKIKRFY